MPKPGSPSCSGGNGGGQEYRAVTRGTMAGGGEKAAASKSCQHVWDPCESPEPEPSPWPRTS